MHVCIKRTETLEELAHLRVKLPPSCQHVMPPFAMLLS